MSMVLQEVLSMRGGFLMHVALLKSHVVVILSWWVVHGLSPLEEGDGLPMRFGVFFHHGATHVSLHFS